MDDIQLGDVWQMRKPHPCGSELWTVIRVGADIKIRCRGCSRIVMMDRETFIKRRKRLALSAMDAAAEEGEKTIHG